jgi:6-phosphogluconolactonase
MTELAVPPALSGGGLLVLPDGDRLASAVAGRIVARLVGLQAEQGEASLVLTGGRTGAAVLECLRTSPVRDAVDWRRVDFFWGDERFVPAEDAERNERQTRDALLDHLPIDPRRIHPIAAQDGPHGDDVDAAARAYADVLDARGEGRIFDICLLGMGEEGHVASLFPDSPAVRERHRTVVGVRDCPKPPPTRISLTLPALRRSREVWVMTTGPAKAEAVAATFSGVSPELVPAAGVRGLERTMRFVDAAAAARLRAG